MSFFFYYCYSLTLIKTLKINTGLQIALLFNSLSIYFLTFKEKNDLRLTYKPL